MEKEFKIHEEKGEKEVLKEQTYNRCSFCIKEMDEFTILCLNLSKTFNSEGKENTLEFFRLFNKVRFYIQSNRCGK